MIHFRFEGGAELASRLASLPTFVNQPIQRKALKAGAQPMRARMAQLAPRGPGPDHLADHIIVTLAARLGSTGGGLWRAREEGEEAIAVGPSKHVYWGLFQEYGTVNHGGQPFARPAFDGSADASLRIIRGELWAGLKRVGQWSRPTTGLGSVGARLT